MKAGVAKGLKTFGHVMKFSVETCVSRQQTNKYMGARGGLTVQ